MEILILNRQRPSLRKIVEAVGYAVKPTRSLLLHGAAAKYELQASGQPNTLLTQPTQLMPATGIHYAASPEAEWHGGAHDSDAERAVSASLPIRIFAVRQSGSRRYNLRFHANQRP